jgi:hypothetical protein
VGCCLAYMIAFSERLWQHGDQVTAVCGPTGGGWGKFVSTLQNPDPLKYPPTLLVSGYER